MQNIVERRHVLRAAGAVGAAAAAGIAVTDSARADDGGRDNGVVGAWIITHQDDPPGDPTPGKAAVTLGPGGILENVEIAPPLGVGAGSWTGLGGGRFKAVFVTGAPGQNPGDPGVIVEVRPRGRVTGDSISGTYTVAVSNADNGHVQFSGTGKFHGTRLTA